MDNSEKLNQQIRLFIYLVPILGSLPALWTLYRSPKNTPEKKVSRISVSLTLGWIISYGLLWLGSNQSSEILSFRLLYLNALITSGYFLACLIMMIGVWRGKFPYLSPVSPTKSQKI